MNQSLNVILSICIPTYKRGEILRNTLRNITAQDLDGIEIIISDNASEDDTESVVKEFSSLNIKYFCNSENFGSTFNLVKALELASGKYVMLNSDEDDINIENLRASINYFQYREIGLILGTINSFDGTVFRSYKTSLLNRGFWVFFSYSFTLNYMAGIIFLRNEIDFVDLWNEYNSSLTYGLLDQYPHIYLFNKFLLRNDLGLDSGVFVSKREIGPMDFQVSRQLYFYPEKRLEQLEKNITFIKTKTKFNNIKQSILISKLLSQFKILIYGYNHSREKMNKLYYISSPILQNPEEFLKNSIRILRKKQLVNLLDFIIFQLYRILRSITKMTSP